MCFLRANKARTRQDWLQNEDIRNEWGVEPIEDKLINNYKENWKTHLQRMQAARNPNTQYSINQELNVLWVDPARDGTKRETRTGCDVICEGWWCDDMTIQSVTGQFNIFRHNFEDIFYGHMLVNI
jgi:hypothetical protein